ncbi:MADS-box protein SOC1 [Euphorbia lathyris]|uniref:MADS-box protein SOC1 n=1 Tax=Euphorbia lathyris TaxID=212925 RepID=UPI00331342A9
MVRGKTQMRRIENATSRQVTFSKRRNGLLKKAYELSVLCDAEVSLIVFSPRGKLYEFASSDMQETIDRFRKHVKDTQIKKKPNDENMQQLKIEAANMTKKIEHLEVSKKKLLGEGLASCNLEELTEIEKQLEKSVSSVKLRRDQFYKEAQAKFEENEKIRQAENKMLREKLAKLGSLASKEGEENVNRREESTPVSYVETDLFIGLPEMRKKRFLPTNSTVIPNGKCHC